MVLQAIRYDGVASTLSILDQLKVPHNMLYIPITTCEDAHAAIKQMKVRGAPAIALVAVLGLAVELSRHQENDLQTWISERLDYLVTSRPTAVNLHDAAQKLKKVVAEGGDLRSTVRTAAEEMLRADVQDNLAIGKHGADFILQGSNAPLSILTICNTGSLATAGYGTAYSIVNNLHARKQLDMCYFCETRPYNQGARLTSTELLYDKIPSSMVLDSSIAALLAGANKRTSTSPVRAIVVGADRVAANGDTANKIGTYQLAVLARHFGDIKFLVAAPWTTIDLDTKTGQDIVVEERAASEVRQVSGALFEDDGITIKRDQAGVVMRGHVEVCLPEVQVWNPAFDVTPHELIDGIVTERGVYEKNGDGKFELERYGALSGIKPITINTTE
ncbi:S-methyl-5-thioribose-1-phosphate isomerase [Savitreella phatthalungensis]